ncbi:cell division protein ZapA [Blautia sp. 1033sp1_1033st1_G9_1033SCRN_220408]|uniref:cell division protein ZapA n=1 Tax=Blautia sp. 1033sp1_1033st1_G9_1033SCRN_220408 TaxID=3144490 RepID=UPI0034A4FEE2
MAVKNTAQVIIGGKIITLGGYESSEYFQQVANYMNRKLSELSEMPGYSRQPMETKHTLLSLNITDDYFKARKQVETYEQDLQQKDQEMYDLKHELISLKIQMEEARKTEQDAIDQKNRLEGKVKELEKELDEMLK